MSAPELIYCRFCAEQKPIKEIIDLAITLEIRRAIIEQLSFFSIKWVDFTVKSLPETICDICYSSLVSAYGFFTKIKISQAVLSNMILNNLKHEKDSFAMCIKEEPSLNESDINDIFQKSDEEMDTTPDIPEEFLTSVKELVEDSKETSSWDTYPWVCKYCKVCYRGVNELRDHSKDCHGECCSYQCADCDAVFNYFNEFVEHVRGHRESLKTICQYCNLKLEDDTKHPMLHASRSQCNTCGELFSTKSALRSHLTLYPSIKRSKKRKSTFTEPFSYDVTPEIDRSMANTESWSDYPWICQYCEMKVADLDSLKVHLKEVHVKCFGVKCADCDQLDGLSDFSSFFDHVRGHRPSLNLYCHDCNHHYQDDVDKIIHASAHNVAKHRCDLCGEVFRSSTSLRKHKTLYDPPKSKSERRQRPLTVQDLTCGICQKVAKSASNLFSHKKLHTDRQRDFFCDRCGKSFFTKGALTTHNLIHDKPDPVVCKICKKSFLTLTRLKKHVNTHYGEKPFECAECHKRFRLKEHLKGHMIIHTDVFPYHCKYCNKKFHFKNVLKNHEVIHTGARPYKCDVCGMDFTCWSNCNKHMIRKHGATLAKSKMTPNGKVPINSKTCKLKKINLDEGIKEWTEQILVSRKRGKKIDMKMAEITEEVESN